MRPQSIPLASPAASSLLYGPALPVLSPQIIVGLQHVGDAHVDTVVVDLSSGAQSHDAEEHNLGETGGVLERTGSFHFPLRGIHPVHFVSFAGDARELLRGFAEGIVERLRPNPRLEAVGVVNEVALAAD